LGRASGSRRPAADSGVDSSAFAQRLAHEFGSPVGLFDPLNGTWLVRSGAPAEAFPAADPTLLDLLVREGLAQGRVTTWSESVASPVKWLFLPVPRRGGMLVAAAGFASPGADATAAARTWGPVCPEPALRAWGQSVAELIRSGHLHAANGSSIATKSHDGGERQFVSRLIRRLRISDPPERFQHLATNALRAAMNVQALAWVPSQHSEPVVVSGELGDFKGDGYRTLIPTAGRDSISFENEPSSSPDPGLKRWVSVASDSNKSIGWLIAMNPLDGRFFSQADSELMQPVASLVATQQANARVYAELKELLFGVIRALTAAIDAKDPYTAGHSERVARIALRLAEELGMSTNQRGDLYLMGLLHDVGKIGVDDSVLKKTGPLTPEEYRLIQAHVEIGVHILKDLKKLSHLLPGVRHHHESLDGTGYPVGLAGDAIPYEARILAVADAYDAMSSTRPYRRRLTPSQIDDVLRRGSGVQWDPKVIDALFSSRMDLELIRQKGLGESLQVAVSETLGRT
jgi:HD-GYP domain-containing protein (c-di-GMP phosphodiesterase class II)